MGQQANIGEIRAVGELRGNVVESAETIGRIVDDCNSHMQRFVDWVCRDRASYWKMEQRRRDQKVQTARSDLERAKIAKPDADPRSFTEQMHILKRARAALEEAGQKRAACKRWTIELERQALLLRAGLRPVAAMADADLPKATRWLQQLEKHLAGYLAEAPALPDDVPEDTAADASLPSRGRSGQRVDPASDTADASKEDSE